MSYILPLTPDQATGTVADQYTAIKKALGVVPNLMQGMAQSPVVLTAYLSFSGTLAKGPLSGRLREKIALATAQTNGCDYCLAAHTLLAKGVKVTEDDTLAARRGESADPKEDAILKFAQSVSNNRGNVSEADWASIRAAGVSDSEAVAVIGEVALNVLTNYFNNATGTEIDFPAAPAIK